MDILKTILSNPELSDKIYRKCDIEIYHKMRKPEDMDGKIMWTFDGMAFGCDASGSEFVLLSDGTIGFNGSEGETGRIAENIRELFSLLVNCPCFYDFLVPNLYTDDELLAKYADALEADYKSHFNDNSEYDWDTVKAEIATTLDLIIDSDISKNTLKTFYTTATREPQYQFVYHETDGSYIKSECIISGPMRDWILKKAGMQL